MRLYLQVYLCHNFHTWFALLLWHSRRDWKTNQDRRDGETVENLHVECSYSLLIVHLNLGVWVFQRNAEHLGSEHPYIEPETGRDRMERKGEKRSLLFIFLFWRYSDWFREITSSLMKMYPVWCFIMVLIKQMMRRQSKDDNKFPGPIMYVQWTENLSFPFNDWRLKVRRAQY